MKRVFISLSFKHRKEMSEEVCVIKEMVQKYDMLPFVFVDEYVFSSDQEKAMMDQAIKDMDASSLLIAELSEKAIGVGFEVGYAVARNIPVLYLKKEGAAYSKIVGGICSGFISYSDTTNLAVQLDTYFRS